MVGKYTGLSDSYLSVLKVNKIFLQSIMVVHLDSFYLILLCNDHGNDFDAFKWLNHS